MSPLPCPLFSMLRNTTSTAMQGEQPPSKANTGTPLPGPPSPTNVRSRVHEDGAHFVHTGILQVGADTTELMAAALEVLLLEDRNLQENEAMRAGHGPH